MFVNPYCSHERRHVDRPAWVEEKSVMDTDILLGKYSHVEINTTIGKIPLEILNQLGFEKGVSFIAAIKLFNCGEQVDLSERSLRILENFAE